jgi:hypothetical protein
VSKFLRLRVIKTGRVISAYDLKLSDFCNAVLVGRSLRAAIGVDCMPMWSGSTRFCGSIRDFFNFALLAIREATRILCFFVFAR